MNQKSAGSFVEIIATYYDQNGHIMGTDSTFSEPYDLKPNMKAPFQMSLGEAVVGEIGSYDLTITWRDTDGSQDSKSMNLPALVAIMTTNYKLQQRKKMMTKKKKHLDRFNQHRNRILISSLYFFPISNWNFIIY